MWFRIYSTTVLAGASEKVILSFRRDWEKYCLLSAWTKILHNPWSLTSVALKWTSKQMHIETARDLIFAWFWYKTWKSPQASWQCLWRENLLVKQERVSNEILLPPSPVGIYMVFLWTFHATLKIKCFLTGSVFSLLCIFWGWLPRDPDLTPSCASMASFCDPGKSFFLLLLPPFSSLLSMYKQVRNQSLHVICSHTEKKCNSERLGFLVS